MDSGKLTVRPEPATIERYVEPLNAAPGGVSRYYGPEENVFAPLFLYWHRILRHKWEVLAVVVVLTTLVTLGTLKMRPRYDAVARLAINRENPDMLGFKDVGSSPSDDDWDYKIALETQLQVLQSDSLALQVIRQLHLDQNAGFLGKAPEAKYAAAQPASSGQPGVSQPVTPYFDPKHETDLLKLFHAHLAVNVVPRSRMVEITVSSYDPKLSADIANTLVNGFIEQNFRAKYETTMQTSQWLSQELTDLQRKFETAQEQLVRYQRENGILGIDEKQNIVTSKLDDLNKQLTQAETDRIRKESDYRLTKSGNLELIPGLAENKIVGKLKEQQADLQNQYAQATVKLGPAHPRVLELKNQLSQVQTSLNTELSNVGGRIENEYRAALQQEKMLRSALDQQKQQANALNQAAITYNLLKRDVETSRQLYEGLLTKMKEASVSAGMKANNIRPVDVARVPAFPAHPNLPLNIGLGFFASIVLGVAFAFAREAMDNTVRTPEDVQLVAGLPSLGMVPLNLAPKRVEKQTQALLPRSAAQEGRPSILTHAAPSSHLAEAYRAIRSALLLSSSGKPPQVILISSPLPGDGKTTTSVNTAIVLAQNGGRVLLIDADLRRSQVHKALGVPNGPGLSAVLSGNETLESQITRSREVPNLFVMTAGAAPPYPAELLGSQKMSELIQQFRKDFDFVVIDTPPLISVTDAVILSRQVDGILLVVHSGKTNKGALSRARELLALVNARVLGVLVNAVDLHSQAGYYSYGYGYSYAKYYGDYSSNSTTTAAAGK